MHRGPPVKKLRDHLVMKQLIEAAGGVVFRIREAQPQVILIYRRGVWDLPKGKRDEGETLDHCAAREVSEEVGIPMPMVLARLETTRHSYTFDGQTMHKITHWYSMISIQNTLVPQAEERIERVGWFPVHEARSMVGYDNLRGVLAAFTRWYAAIMD